MEKAGLIGLVKLRYIESDENLSLRGDKLKEAIKTDRENGLVPFFVSHFLSEPFTISFCSFVQPLELPEPVHLIIYRNWDQFAR